MDTSMLGRVAAC